jgi:cyclopropane-fatty-acyl-phospholipid synthase
LRGRLHSRERDRAAVTYHYDAGNEFYALFLGQSMAEVFPGKPDRS